MEHNITYDNIINKVTDDDLKASSRKAYKSYINKLSGFGFNDKVSDMQYYMLNPDQLIDTINETLTYEQACNVFKVISFCARMVVKYFPGEHEELIKLLPKLEEYKTHYVDPAYKEIQVAKEDHQAEQSIADNHSVVNSELTNENLDIIQARFENHQKNDVNAAKMNKMREDFAQLEQKFHTLNQRSKFMLELIHDLVEIVPNNQKIVSKLFKLAAEQYDC